MNIPSTSGSRDGTSHRVLLLAVSAVLLLAYAVLLTRWIDLRHQQGWVGLSYQGHVEGSEEMRGIALFDLFLVGQGEIQMVHARSAADRAGLHRGQRIVAIEGIPVQDQAALEELARRVRVGDVLAYRIEAGEGTERTEREVPIRLGSPFRVPNLLLGITVNTVVALGYLAIGLLVVWSRPRNAQAVVFSLLCTAGAAFFFFISFAELDMQGARGLLSNVRQNAETFPYLVAYALVGLVVSNLLLHLILIFPRRRPLVEAHPRILVWLHTAPFLPAVAITAFFAVLSVDPPGVWQWAPTAAGSLVLLVLLAGLGRRARQLGAARALAASPLLTQAAVLAAAVALAPSLRLLGRQEAMVASGLAVASTILLYMLVAPVVYVFLCLIPLIRNYRQAGVEGKRQLRWPLWGTSTSLGVGILIFLALFTCATIDPELAQRAWWSPVAHAAFKLLNLLIPASFAFAIAKYRLMDIDLILRRTAIYGASSAVVVLAYLVAVAGAGLVLLDWLEVRNQVVAVLAPLVLALLFVPVRNRVQGWVDRRFGRGGPGRGEALEQVRRAVVGSPDLASLLPRVAETVQQALGTRTLVLFVQEPEGRRLVARAKVGVPDEVLGRLGIAPTALAGAGRVGEVDPLPFDDEDRERMRRLRLELVAPARRQGEVVGAVAVGSKLDGSETGADDRELLSAVADQLALAVGSLGPRREELELDQARVLQRSLLPERVPRLPGVELEAIWRPAREVAGDYYDVLDLGDGKLALCIGDVAGKGMAAALLMSSLQAAVRAVAASDVAPERVCRQVRRVVVQGLAGGRFVTFFYALLDVPGRRLAFCNAGHAPPLLVRADGRVEWLETGGGAFARLLADSPLEGGARSLSPGDRLVLYTDGITEAHDGDGRMLGDAGLVDSVLPGGDAEETCRRLLAAVAQRSGPVAADDVTLVVARLAPDDAVELPITDVLDLHSFPPREVADVVRDYLDAAYERGFREVRLIHGKGIGVQRQTVRKILEADRRVVRFGDAGGGAGGWGATVVELE